MDWDFENSLIPSGVTVVCGIDETGRGPLAGDVFAGAVILPKNVVIDGLNDSKKLSERKREILYPIIKEKAVTWAVARASVSEIDSMNILEATLLAMRRALDALTVCPEFLLIDGNIDKDFVLPRKAVISGDSLCPSIAAASVLAKVDRDRYMLELHDKYPEYGFDKHKGYGTKQHRAAIKKYGRTPEHRVSFIGKIPTGVY